MAKGMKKVSVSAVDKVIKENFCNVTEYQWHGLDVSIKHSISLDDMMAIVNGVADNCFLDDGTYLPETIPFLTKWLIVVMYTNISLPENIDRQYQIIYNSDLIPFVMTHINEKQVSEIEMAIAEKVDYICHNNIVALQEQMDELIGMFEEVQEEAKGVFEGVDADDIRRMSDALSSGELSEEKIVQAYMEQKNKPHLVEM